MKRLFYLVLLFTAANSFAYDFQAGDLYYNVTNYNEPYTVGVTYEEYWSSNNYVGLTTAVIPESVTYNGITYSVTSIENKAFYGCSSLTSVEIPNSVTRIGYESFEGTGLYNNESNWENGVLYIGNCLIKSKLFNPNGFFNGTSESRGFYTTSEAIAATEAGVIYKRDSLKVGGIISRWCKKSSAFDRYHSVSFFIMDPITGQEHEFEFYNCYSLARENFATYKYTDEYNAICIDDKGREFHLGDTVVGAGVYDIYNGTHELDINCYLTEWRPISTASSTPKGEYAIKNGTRLIADGAFSGCSGLTYVTIPNGVTDIGEKVFQHCSSLTAIDIPNSVTKIGNEAFGNCSSLVSIAIPNNVTNIGEKAFYNCSSLTVINIPNSVTDIEGGTFESCSSLTSVNIPNSVTRIGYRAFQYCSSLTSMIIPNSVTSIEVSAFYMCSSLTSITIPNSVTKIGDEAFGNCSSLTSINIPNNVTDIANIMFYGCSSLTSVTIGNNVKRIGEGAFQHCSSLTSVTIPTSVTWIGEKAFYSCSALTSIESLAEAPPRCGTFAFAGVSRSIPVYVPCGKIEIYKATDEWKSFSNIQEPLLDYSIVIDVKDNHMGTAKVDFNNFCEGCQISATANYGYHFVKWSDGNIDNPRTLKLIQDTMLTAEFALTNSGQCGDNLYWQYTGTTLAITGTGNMWEDIPWQLFIDSITTVNIANGATSISESSFANCKKLNKLILPASIEEIGANAFSGCRMLYDIYCFATLPPMADASSFTNYNAYLYVPCEAQRYYKADMVFSKFLNTECISSDNVETEVVVVTPGSTDVTITWPTDSYAETYVIVIEQGDKVFCTLTFDADGRLLNIAFAPSRSNNHPAMNAGSTGSGLRFTITNLEEGTTYEYNIITKDGEDKVISTYTGEFTTKGNVATTVSDVQHPITDDKKILRNGQLLIFHDGKTYNAQGTLVGNN